MYEFSLWYGKTYLFYFLPHNIIQFLDLRIASKNCLKSLPYKSVTRNVAQPKNCNSKSIQATLKHFFCKLFLQHFFWNTLYPSYFETQSYFSFLLNGPFWNLSIVILTLELIWMLFKLDNYVKGNSENIKFRRKLTIVQITINCMRKYYIFSFS